MTIPAQPESPAPPLAERLGLFRRRQDRVIAGVAGGLADRLGVGDVYVRAAFATLATMFGLGILIYVVLWRMTSEFEDDREPRTIDSRQRIGLALAFIGGIWILSSMGLVIDGFAAAVVFTLSFGVAALWDRSESPSLARIILPDGGGGRSVVRLIGGMVLVIGGLGPPVQFGIRRFPDRVHPAGGGGHGGRFGSRVRTVDVSNGAGSRAGTPGAGPPGGTGGSSGPPSRLGAANTGLDSAQRGSPQDGLPGTVAGTGVARVAIRSRPGSRRGPAVDRPGRGGGQSGRRTPRRHRSGEGGRRHSR